MITLEDIRSNCRIEDVEVGKPHLLWAGGKAGKVPRIWAPDYTATKRAFRQAMKLEGGSDAGIVAALVDAMTPIMTAQSGRRAAYHLETGKPLPKGWRVFATCSEPTCIEHYAAGSTQTMGAQFTLLGWHTDSIPRKVAALKNGRKRSKLTPEIIREIRNSPEKGIELSRRFGIGQPTISKVRVHGSHSHESVANPWAGLGGRAA